MGRLQAVFFALILAGWFGPAAGSELGRFLSGFDKVFVSYREAASYLRTGNVDLAALALEDMKEGFEGLRSSVSGNGPGLMGDTPLFEKAMTSTGNTIDRALAMIDADKPTKIRETLLALRPLWRNTRAAAGLYALTDCIYDANRMMADFMAYKSSPPDWNDAAATAEAIGKAAVLRHLLARCDALAAPKIRKAAEFRRLVDGLRGGLALVPQAAAAKDGGRLFRILIEIRSFDRLLFFRYG